MAHTKKLLLVALALTAAGCAKKRPAVLPPAPGAETSAQAGATGAGDGTGGRGAGAVVPGSREDFMRSVRADTVHFALDHFDIDAEARGILDTQADWLQKFPNVRITLEGHCDERGTREYNLALGDRRANAAKNYLAARGIATARISTISYGKERPVALGSDETSWAQNRRAVTVTVQ